VRVFQLNEIIDVKSGHRVVTAIEVLGPTNQRPGEGQRLYLQKREDQQSAAVNTVEIDLLRGGTWDLTSNENGTPALRNSATRIFKSNDQMLYPQRSQYFRYPANRAAISRKGASFATSASMVPCTFVDRDFVETVKIAKRMARRFN
jgi:hypothetical protein